MDTNNVVCRMCGRMALLAVMAAVCAPIESDAASRAWVGGGAGDPNDWFNPLNWDGGLTPPEAGDAVVVNVAKASILLTNTPPRRSAPSRSAPAASPTPPR